MSRSSAYCNVQGGRIRLIDVEMNAACIAAIAWNVTVLAVKLWLGTIEILALQLGEIEVQMRGSHR